MGKIFTDKWTRYHDDETDEVEPSSNNGWIYTAYANKLDLPFNRDKLELCYAWCLVRKYPMLIYRTPYDSTPPISRDEIIGLASLNLLHVKYLAKCYWQYHNPQVSPKPVPLRKLNWLEVAKGFWEIKKATKNLKGSKKRNYTWENKIYEVYPVVFRLPPPDIYYIKKLYGHPTTRTESILFKASAIQTLLKPGKSKGVLSAKNIIWLQLKDLKMEKSFIYKLVKVKFNIINYFGEEHIFSKAVV